MAIINCPACKNRISDKAKICSHCNYNFASRTASDGTTKEQLESKSKLARIKRRYSLQMQAMAGIILFLLGIVLWYFVGDQGLSQVSHFIELGMAAVGAAWYLITRIRLLMFKRSQ